MPDINKKALKILPNAIETTFLKVLQQNQYFMYEEQGLKVGRIFFLSRLGSAFPLVKISVLS